MTTLKKKYSWWEHENRITKSIVHIKFLYWVFTLKQNLLGVIRILVFLEQVSQTLSDILIESHVTSV